MSFFERAGQAHFSGLMMVDGASPFGVFWRICLPMVLPGLNASAILAFIIGTDRQPLHRQRPHAKGRQRLIGLGQGTSAGSSLDDPRMHLS